MIECFSPEVRDFLPDLVHGRLGEVDNATMLAHVEACAACGAELAMLREVRSASPVVASVDVARIVAMLPAPAVTHIPKSPSPARRSAVWMTAAAVAMLAIVGVFTARSTNGPAAVAEDTAAPVAVAAVPSPSETSQPEESLALVAGLQELTDEEIQSLLTELDQIETIPSAEPNPSAIAVEDSEVLPR